MQYYTSRVFLFSETNVYIYFIRLKLCLCKILFWAHCVPFSSADGTVVVDLCSSHAVHSLSLMLCAEAFQSAHHTHFPVSVPAWLLPVQCWCVSVHNALSLNRCVLRRILTFTPFDKWDLCLYQCKQALVSGFCFVLRVLCQRKCLERRLKIGFVFFFYYSGC